MDLTIIEQGEGRWIGIPETHGKRTSYKKLAELSRDTYEACVHYGYPRIKNTIAGHKVLSEGEADRPQMMKATPDPNAPHEWTLFLAGWGGIGNISDKDAVALAASTDVEFPNGLPAETAEARIQALEDQASALMQRAAEIRNEARTLRTQHGLDEVANAWNKLF